MLLFDLCTMLAAHETACCPVYTLWVVYCFVYSVYDRTTNFWWPYIFNLFLESAAKTRDGFKFKPKSP